MFQPVTKPGKTQCLLMLVALALIVALLGGSSNARVVQLAGLRPLAALFLIPIIYYWNGAKSGEERALLYLLLGAAGWMLLQLVPLPQWAWGQLPDRDLIVELDGILGLEPQWRPISWVPSRGWNALAAMIVPAAALLLAIALRARNETLLQIVLGIALLNSLLAITQVISGNPESLYLYDPRSNGSDGLFGNENHSGVFSAVGVLIAARLFSQTSSRTHPWRQLIYGGSLLVIFLAVLIGGSRAGLAAGAGAFAGSIAMLYFVGLSSKSRSRSSSHQTRRRTLLALMTVFLVSLAAVFIWLDRSPSFDGILSESAFEGLRWSLNPILWEMITKNWLFGIGFGAFEEYYHIYEPNELLIPKFINLAHNDWAQLVLEGGLFACILVALLMAWAIRQVSRLFSQGYESFPLLIFWIALFGVVAFASLVDYPVRTPIFQFALAWLLLCLARDGLHSDVSERSEASRERSPSRQPGALEDN